MKKLLLTLLVGLPAVMVADSDKNALSEANRPEHHLSTAHIVADASAEVVEDLGKDFQEMSKEGFALPASDAEALTLTNANYKTLAPANGNGEPVIIELNKNR